METKFRYIFWSGKKTLFFYLVVAMILIASLVYIKLKNINDIFFIPSWVIIVLILIGLIIRHWMRNYSHYRWLEKNRPQEINRSS